MQLNRGGSPVLMHADAAGIMYVRRRRRRDTTSEVVQRGQLNHGCCGRTGGGRIVRKAGDTMFQGCDWIGLCLCDTS